MPVNALTHRTVTGQYNMNFSVRSCDKASKQLINTIAANAQGEYSRKRHELAKLLTGIVNTPECKDARKRYFSFDGRNPPTPPAYLIPRSLPAIVTSQGV